jgi:hypothetical protein
MDLNTWHDPILFLYQRFSVVCPASSWLPGFNVTMDPLLLSVWPRPGTIVCLLRCHTLVFWLYSGRKITASFGNDTVRGEKYGKGKGEARRRRVCLSMYSIIENIYYSQLSSFVLLLQPETVSHRIIQGKDWVLSPYVLSSCGFPLSPTCLQLGDQELATARNAIVSGSWLVWILSTACVYYVSRRYWSRQLV